MAEPHTSLRSANIARQAEWDPGSQISLTYRGVELAGEVGEACNIIKKLERERLGIRGSRAKVDQLAEELADVVICTDLIALAEGIDLDAAVTAKFNATSEKVGLETRLAPTGVQVIADLRQEREALFQLLDERSIPAALADIALERRRQVEVEGWTDEHDDQYPGGELAQAAAAYAWVAGVTKEDATSYAVGRPPHMWPWPNHWWKPKNKRHDLVRAAALIVAEIQRMDRATTAAPAQELSHGR